MRLNSEVGSGSFSCGGDLLLRGMWGAWDGGVQSDLYLDLLGSMFPCWQLWSCFLSMQQCSGEVKAACLLKHVFLHLNIYVYDIGGTVECVHTFLERCTILNNEGACVLGVPVYGSKEHCRAFLLSI